MSREVKDSMTEDLVSLRTEVRLAEFGRDFWPNWDTGGCYMVTECLHVERGWAMEGGCYVEGSVHADDHFWNVDGDTIIDATADQFGEPGDGVRFTVVGDPRYRPNCSEHYADW